MTAPLIGITTYDRDEGNRFSLPSEYVDAVRRAGAIVVLVPPGDASPDALFSMLDGLLLAGGGDVDPKQYQGEEHEMIYMVDVERDRCELALARRASETGFPMLGICRGAQVINVALGGTLYPHLPDVVGESVKHRLPPREPTPHSIAVNPDSRLAAGLDQVVEFDAPSWHHQAIRDVANGLVVVAHAPDGVIEAVEMPEHPWLIGVQWHPELSAAYDPTQQRLFDAFVRAAAGHTSSRR